MPAPKHDTKNVFTTMWDNAKMAPDAYPEGTIDPISQIKNTFLGGDNPAIEALGDLQSKLEDAMGFMKEIESAMNGSLLDRLTTLGGLSKSIAAAVGLKPPSPLLDVLSKGSNFIANVNGIYKKLKNIDFKNIDGLFKLAGEFTGMKEFFKLADFVGQASFMVNLVKEIANQGIPGVLGAFKDLIEKSPLKHDIIREITPNLIKNQDLDSIQILADMVDYATFQNLTGQYMQNIAANWNTDKQPFELKDHDWWKKFEDTFTKTKGRDWMYGERGVNPITRHGTPKTVIDIEPFIGGSPRFHEIVKNGGTSKNQWKINPTSPTQNDHLYKEPNTTPEVREDDKKYLYLAKHFYRTSVKAAIRRDFPKVAIAPTQVYLRDNVSAMDLSNVHAWN